MYKEQFFETIKIYEGKIYNIAYHQERFEKTSLLHVNLKNYITPSKTGLYRCKIIYDMKEIISVEYFPYKKKKIRSIAFVECNDIQYRRKYLDRSRFDALIDQVESDEILIIKNGLITDTSIANVAFYDGKKWITPKSFLLEGTTRKRYLQQGVLEERELSLQNLESFSKIAFLNAMVDFDIMSIENILEDGMIVK